MKNKLMELGRSMVEMLGVLAIIGVLSIVGIQGYKKAMLKIKANDAWESVMRWRNEVHAMRTVGITCTGNWAISADKPSIQKYLPGAGNYSYFDRPEFLPPFADSAEDFAMYVKCDDALSEVQMRNIHVNGLCYTILPDPTTIKTDYIQKTIDGVVYKCYRRESTVEL